MDIKNTILVKKGSKDIGRFSKVINMPSLPPVGCIVNFGERFGGVSAEVLQVSFYEREGLFASYYEIDVCVEENRLKDYIPDDYYPKKLVNNCEFSVDWLEEGYENLLNIE